MATAYINEHGVHIPDYSEILEDLKEEFRGIFGPDVYLEPDSQEGQLLSIFALRIHDCHTLAASVYNAFSPQTAQGAGLSSVVKVNGLRRRGASHSQVDLRVIGRPGTVISGGVATDTADQRWLLPDLTIPVGGEITVTALAEDPGEIRAAAGEITNIATPVYGWQAVTNAEAAVPGSAVETDADLRGRQRISTAIPSQTVFDGIVGGVSSVSGVTRCRGYENDSSVEDSNGLPPHSVSLVVEGGDAQAVATAIALKKTPGCGTHGDVEVGLRDVYGSASVIKFFRPTPVAVAVRVSIRPLSGYVSATGETIRKNLSAHISALEIGEDVMLSKLYTPINAAEPVAGRRSFDVLSLQIGVGAPLSAENLSIDFNAAASCALDDVELEVVSA